MSELAIIIVSWNVRAWLDRCLTSLRDDLARTDVEAHVWVVDNASEDGSAVLVQNQHPWVQLEALDENLGFVRGNNLVLERFLVQGVPDFVWLLNPDTEIRPGATQTLLDAFAALPRAGLLGPQLRNPDGTLQHGAFRFPGLFQPLLDLGMLPLRFYDTRLNGRYMPSDYAKRAPFRIDYPLGAAMMARGAALAQIGPLDPAFFMYCEEIDWAWRMRKAGWEAWLVPQAEVIHHGGASTGQARPQTTAHLWESRARLYRKHHGALLRIAIGALVRRRFAQKAAASDSAEWRAAYERIIRAWQ